jgi:hypothetical protein
MQTITYFWQLTNSQIFEDYTIAPGNLSPNSMIFIFIQSNSTDILVKRIVGEIDDYWMVSLVKKKKQNFCKIYSNYMRDTILYKKCYNLGRHHFIFICRHYFTIKMKYLRPTSSNDTILLLKMLVYAAARNKVKTNVQ